MSLLFRVCLFALFVASPLVAFGQSEKFELVRVAEGVYAAIRKEPPGLMFEANNVFIINDDDVLVVDSNISPTATREVLAALRKLTTKPVRYVVNTHWHEDHIIGNQVYREAFPGVEFIGHTSTLADLPTVGAANRKSLLEGGPAYAAQIKSMLEQNKTPSGRELTAEERASHTSTVALAERYFAEAKGFQIILPTLAVEERLTLYRGGRTIEIRHLGRAHTGADLVIHLPKENILITGDLVVWPVPLIGSTSYPAEYAATLEKMLALRPAIIIPGHGPVMRDDSYVRQTARMLDSLKQQTAAAVARGETLEQARKSVDLGEFRKLFAGDSPLKGLIFDSYVASSGVAAAFSEASSKR